MKLHTLISGIGARKKKKIKARGQGSGKGGTATRGNKGAQSRSGYKKKGHFEGGQTPLQRRMPKFGGNHPKKNACKCVNLRIIDALAGKKGCNVIDLIFLQKNGLLSSKQRCKVLGQGQIKRKLEIHAHACSASARQAIEKQGGKVIIIA